MESFSSRDLHLFGDWGAYFNSKPLETLVEVAGVETDRAPDSCLVSAVGPVFI